MHTTRRHLIVAGTAALTAPWALAQQDWPNRSVKLIVPFPPGGASDIVGRLIAVSL